MEKILGDIEARMFIDEIDNDASSAREIESKNFSKMQGDAKHELKLSQQFKTQQDVVYYVSTTH